MADWELHLTEQKRARLLKKRGQRAVVIDYLDADGEWRAGAYLQPEELRLIWSSFFPTKTLGGSPDGD